MRHVLNVTLNSDGQLVTARFGTTRGAYRRAVADAQPHLWRARADGARHCHCRLAPLRHRVLAGAQEPLPRGHDGPSGRRDHRGDALPRGRGRDALGDARLRGVAGPTRSSPVTNKDEFDDPVAASLATAWARVREHARVILVSDGVAREDARALAFDRADTVEAALEIATANARANPSVGVLTHAPDTLPSDELDPCLGGRSSPTT